MRWDEMSGKCECLCLLTYCLLFVLTTNDFSQTSGMAQRSGFASLHDESDQSGESGAHSRQQHSANHCGVRPNGECASLRVPSRLL